MGAMKTGGQGSVYKGRRTGPIMTAIKILPTPIHSESTDDKNFLAFQNEVQKLKKVNEVPNPNVVKILSSGITESGSLPYIEMEYIEGPDLEDLLKPPHEPIFTITEILKVANQLSNALAHCHKMNVRHGDIKSNNVKQNINTGNYVLLDFGLAIMSDEQRRTSLRHAGAAEFMAPEQTEGQMLFETDVYSFGVILFELVAGTVPFPLKDNGDTARNIVMLAHQESPPPDILSLRQQHLPANWNDAKKTHEMQVPAWLVSMVYKCLEKNPGNRFRNGIELHEHIVRNSIQPINNSTSSVNLNILEQEVERLKRENESLQSQLAKYQQIVLKGGSRNSLRKEIEGIPTPAAKSYGLKGIVISFIIAIAVIAGVYAYVNKRKVENTTTTSKTGNVGEYKVLAARAYFHNEPDEKTRRNAYAVPSGLIIKAADEKNGFIYTEIRNEQGQTSKGWLRKQDLVTLDEFKRNNTGTTNNVEQKEIRTQLTDAQNYLNSGQLAEALFIYKNLSNLQVPEAMYQYGNLALQNMNEQIDCKQGFDLLIKAAGKGYTPAKTALGLLYSFANDENVLQSNNYYNRCEFTENVTAGAKLLMEATLEGDLTASRLLQDLNAKSQAVTQ